jgi:hypothetical protein
MPECRATLRIDAVGASDSGRSWPYDATLIRAALQRRNAMIEAGMSLMTEEKKSPTREEDASGS